MSLFAWNQIVLLLFHLYSELQSMVTIAKYFCLRTEQTTDSPHPKAIAQATYIHTVYYIFSNTYYIIGYLWGGPRKKTYIQKLILEIPLALTDNGCPKTQVKVHKDQR